MNYVFNLKVHQRLGLELTQVHHLVLDPLTLRLVVPLPFAVINL